MVKKSKLAIVALLCSMASLGVYADLQYQYDASGNRTARVIVLPQHPQNSPRMMSHGGEVTVSPTVTTDLVNISTTLDPEMVQISYVLSNLQGSVLAFGDIECRQTTISLGHYPCGIYLLTVQLDQNLQSFKIFKQ